MSEKIYAIYSLVRRSSLPMKLNKCEQFPHGTFWESLLEIYAQLSCNKLIEEAQFHVIKTGTRAICIAFHTLWCYAIGRLLCNVSDCCEKWSMEMQRWLLREWHDIGSKHNTAFCLLLINLLTLSLAFPFCVFLLSPQVSLHVACNLHCTGC